MMFTTSAKRLEGRSNLYRQWASLLEAGVPMVRALHTLARAASNRRERRGLTRTAAAIERGSTLSEGLARSSRGLPRLDLALIDVGERTGKLEVCLDLLSAAARHQAGLVRDIISGIGYPVVVLHVAILVFPIQAVQNLVLQGDVAGYLLGKIPPFAVLYLALFLVGRVTPFLFTSQAGVVLEAVLRTVPALGPGLRDLAHARLAVTLRAQLEAGIPAIAAWRTAGDVCGSPALHRAIGSWDDALEEGATPGEMAAAAAAIDPVFSEFYLSGETSGKLEDALGHVEGVFHESGRARLKTFATWVPRIVYAVIVFYIAYAVVSFWSGHYSSLGLGL